MVAKLNYFGTTAYNEKPVTGVDRIWQPGQDANVSDAHAAQILAASTLFQPIPMSGQRIITSSVAPSNNDGLPDGTVWVQAP